MSIWAWCALLGFGWLTLFQASLALGIPLGRLAWGGTDHVLPPGRRLASGAVVILGAFGCLLSWQALGRATVLMQPVADILHLGLAAVFALSFLGNLFSRSMPERLHGMPLAMLLAVSNAFLGWGAF